MIDLVDENFELSKIRINSTDDPKALLDKITSVETRFSTKTHKIKEEKKTSVMLSQAPMKHKSALTKEQRLNADRRVIVTAKHS